jgi:His/Glu/Gln/Arg/opine family amino acid ABC transporter permease subunit
VISLRPVAENLGLLFGSLLTTVELFAVTLVVSLLPAIVIAVGRLYGPRPLQHFLLAVTYLIRGVPGVLAILIIFYALPFVGPTLDAFSSVGLMLTIIQVVYLSEVFRAALAAVDRGQFEAGTALGLTSSQILLLVVAPQAAIVAAPAFISACIQLMQNTTIASAVGLYDLLGRAQNLAVNYLDGSPILVVAPLYVLILLPIVRLGRRLERRLAVARRI